MLAPDRVSVEPPDFAIEPPPVPLIIPDTFMLLVEPPAPAWMPNANPLRSTLPDTLRVPLVPVLAHDWAAPRVNGKLTVSERPAV